MVYRKSFRLAFPIYCNVDANLLGKARVQRKSMTPAEKKIWQSIRKNKLGVKFRRQHPINRFIADFYCHAAKLIIEIDGGYHDDVDQAAYDIGRSRELERFGIRVIRFTNEEVELDIENVLTRIKKYLEIL